MIINFLSKNKTILFWVFAIIFLATGFNSVNRYKRKTIHLLENTRRASRQALSLALENNYLLNGYEIGEIPKAENELKNSLFFVGHIYPKSGYVDKHNSEYYNVEHPMGFLRTMFHNAPPLRTIFGGDNVEIATDGALEHLLELKSELHASRFILGNHDQYWKKLRNENIFNKIFHKRYYYEDVNEARLIYLHTETKEGVYGLDQAQRTFLKEDALLDNGTYKYALIFLHHSLWADTPITNASYPESQKLIADWKKNMLPLLQQGRTLGIFSGDGGVLSPGSNVKLGNIWHYTTGWSMNREDIPPEWLKIDLQEGGIQVCWQKLIRGKLLVKKMPFQH